MGDTDKTEVTREVGAMPTSPGWWWCESPDIGEVWEPARVVSSSDEPVALIVDAHGRGWGPVSDYSWGGRCVSDACTRPGLDKPAIEGLDKPAIYSVRQAIAETDLPADTSSSDAIRELWGRVELAKAGIALGIDVTEQLQAKLNKAEASERASADAEGRTVLDYAREDGAVPRGLGRHLRTDFSDSELSAWAAVMRADGCVIFGEDGYVWASPLEGSDAADKPEPTAHRTHQGVVDALRGLIVFEAEHEPGRKDVAADLTGLAALVTAYTGTDPRESAEMADRVQFAVTVCDQPEGLGRAVLEAIDLDRGRGGEGPGPSERPGWEVTS